ncbi:urease accessory protein UreF [uncultured Zobellia sp.]|uniref:urease accessory protein UreF n=1 Tax=uncultured Zobellia sp. TaxID=255433 RepID=UPI0025931003|nr:urease accessory protein UreF [uncultured Zobellia sp.]
MTTNLLNLLHLSDPTLPIGGFSHSYGLETYSLKEIVKSPEEVEVFLIETLKNNILPNDASFVSLIYDACEEANWLEILALDELSHASKIPMEIRRASQKLGIRLLKIFTPLIQTPLVEEMAETIKKKETYGHYCTTYALCAHQLNIEKKEALSGFFYNSAIGYITNAVKLIPLGQDIGQKILFKLLPLMEELTNEAMTPNRQTLGISSMGFDIRAMEHENLYSRQYMS